MLTFIVKLLHITFNFEIYASSHTVVVSVLFATLNPVVFIIPADLLVSVVSSISSLPFRRLLNPCRYSS
jgi:hypothetical protein